MATEKRTRLVTPRFTAIWPKLTVGEPDTKFNADGTYTTRGAFDPSKPDVQQFFATLDELVEQSVEAAKKANPKYSKLITAVSPIKDELDDEGNETGKKILSFKLNAKVTAKQGPNIGKTYEFTPKLFDAKGKPCMDVKIGGGSELKISFEPVPYYTAKDKEAGITLRIEGVQVISLVEYRGGADASALGFGEEEGFSAAGAASGGAFEDESADGGADF